MKRRLSTEELFELVSFEAKMCLEHTDWESRIDYILNCLSVVRSRMQNFQLWHKTDPEVLRILSEVNDCKEVNL